MKTEQFCEACNNTGILLNMERCDACEKFDSDESAKLAVWQALSAAYHTISSICEGEHVDLDAGINAILSVHIPGQEKAWLVFDEWPAQ